MMDGAVTKGQDVRQAVSQAGDGLVSKPRSHTHTSSGPIRVGTERKNCQEERGPLLTTEATLLA